MILSNHVTPQGYSEQFPLYEQGSGTVRYDVHVRIEPADLTVSALMVYDRAQQYWLGHRSAQEQQLWGTDQRVAGEVWKRFGKRLPSQVLA